MKKNDYMCPKCKGHLNAAGYIIFSTKNKRNKKGLILLSPDVGSYTYKHHNNYNFEPGEMVDFFCPICQTDLRSSKNPEYAGITMIDHQNMEYEVLFSRKEGVKSTCVFSNEEVEMFGEDAMDYEEVIDDVEY